MMNRDYKAPAGAPPDWRGLCEELVEALEIQLDELRFDNRLCKRARAALAEPVAEGPSRLRTERRNGPFGEWTALVPCARAALAQPEPEVVRPTDEELLGVAAQAIEPYDEIRLNEYEPENNCAIEVYGSELIAFARAVLARWGRPAPVPAEGEVAELVAWLRDRAAGNERFGAPTASAQLTRAAGLLEQCQAAPVPVSEKLPGPEDCDAEGRCWLFSKVEKEWRLIDAGNPGVPHLKYCFSHWLPATALPLPSGEVQP